MRIDRALANRALSAVGQPELQEGDVTSKSYVLIKKFYLSSMLEALESIPLTSGIKRERLTTLNIENNTDYSGAYRLPIDCGKIIALKDKSYYIVEGQVLYTDGSNPVLIFVSNGKISEEKVKEKKDAAQSAGIPFDEEFPEYDPPDYEVLFYQYLELKIASKLALELSGKMQLHQMLLQQMLIVEQALYRNTKSLSAGKLKGHDWW